MKSIGGEVQKVAFGIDAAVVAVGEGDVEAIAEISHFDDGDAWKALGEAAVDTSARAMRALARDTKRLGRERDVADRKSVV